MVLDLPRLDLSAEHALNPRVIKLFRNEPSLDFSDVDDKKPAEVFEVPDVNTLLQAIPLGKKSALVSWQLPVTFPRWHGTSFLTIFVENSWGGQKVRLSGLELLGQE